MNETLNILETVVTDKEMEEGIISPINNHKEDISKTISRSGSPVSYERGKHDDSCDVERDSKGFWVKGQSGNPNGRPPKGKSIAERFRENPQGEGVLKKIFEIASTLGEKEQHGDALQCAKLVIERLVPSLKSSELKMSTEDSGVVIMPAQIPAEVDDSA